MLQCQLALGQNNPWAAFWRAVTRAQDLNSSQQGRVLNTRGEPCKGRAPVHRRWEGEVPESRWAQRTLLALCVGKADCWEGQLSLFIIRLPNEMGSSLPPPCSAEVETW